MTEPTAETDRLHDQILTLQAELAQMRDLLRSENQRANAAIDRETTAEQAALEAEEERDRLRAVPVSSPPADRAALRDRIADTLAAADGWSWVEGFDKPQSPTYRSYQSRADAVLAVLPEPADRAAALREAVAVLDRRASAVDALSSSDFGEEARAVRELADAANELRRLADETPVAPPKAPPMDPVHILGIGADEAQQGAESQPAPTPPPA